jgi:hypothetical protein
LIDYSNCLIQKLSVHKVGNKTNDENLQLSKTILDTNNNKLQELLLKFFITPFSEPEFYAFTFTNEDFNLNPVYNFANQIFNGSSFHLNSINIAKHLYELSVHPQIKSGDLFVSYFKNINIDNEMVDAIGIFKSENQQSFLKLDSNDGEFSIQFEDGINIEKLDKGCLIFNTEKEAGYKVCIVDKANKSAEAQYWKDGFLMLKPFNDDYHHTKAFMSITKNFVTKQLTEDFEVSRADQIDLLNRSIDYFKTHDTFEKLDFENQVFQDEKVIQSFRDFDENFREENDMEANYSFEISNEAVKKQTKIFKSVLKLDKNFHIYIHGNKDLIEQGIDIDGRKFYKIYFDKET